MLQHWSYQGDCGFSVWKRWLRNQWSLSVQTTRSKSVHRPEAVGSDELLPQAIVPEQGCVAAARERRAVG